MMDNDTLKDATAFAVDRLAVGQNNAELYLRLGDAVVIMPPASAKQMAQALRAAMKDHEHEFGAIRLVDTGGEEAKESVPKKVLKTLYRSRKVNPKLLAVNTRRRK